ncbi:hypothetical protein ACPXAO_23800, partial [Salmonella enterica]|uniref:hypothetical protein n=1 Tax=Salmonella enterica TaxID=28901 RepID=UPI003CE6EAAF
MIKRSIVQPDRCLEGEPDTFEAKHRGKVITERPHGLSALKNALVAFTHYLTPLIATDDPDRLPDDFDGSLACIPKLLG